MKRLWNILFLFINLFKIAKNAEDTEAGLAVSERLRNLNVLNDQALTLLHDPASLAVIKSRKLLGSIDLQHLNTYPDGSLAKAYASNMLALGFDPNFYKVLEIKNDATFCMMRLRQTHDIWHVMTGFDTSVPGELGLQAFMYAQTHNPLPTLLIGGRLITATLKNPREALAIIDSVSLGWRMGKQSKSLFPIDWESHWSTPLEELRREYLWSNRSQENTWLQPSIS